MSFIKIPDEGLWERESDPAATMLTAALIHEIAMEKTIEAVSKILGIPVDGPGLPIITISHDTYDWSLEIMVSGFEAWNTFTIDEEEAKKIIDLGCDHFYISFYPFEGSQDKLMEITCDHVCQRKDFPENVAKLTGRGVQ